MSAVRQRPGVVPAVSSPLADKRFEGREAFRGAIRDAIERATQCGWRHAIFCDVDFADWPLGERDVAAALDNWARGGARFTLLAHHYDDMLRRHARFVHWRTRWSHRIDCWQMTSASTPALPSVLWTASWVLHRIDPVRSVCLAGSDPARRVAMRGSIDHVLRTASAAFAATTLGL